MICFVFSSRRRHTRCALVTGVQTCALPICYQMAQRRLADWLADGTLVTDDRPSFTVYRMVATDDAGVERRTTGVIGALELSPPGTDILPHEQTTPKAKSDRLDLLRSCHANLDRKSVV